MAPSVLISTHLASTNQRRPLRPPDNHPVIQPDDILLLFDFADPATVNDWSAVDDRVMGGVSRSSLRHDPVGHQVLEGTVSLSLLTDNGFESLIYQANFAPDGDDWQTIRPLIMAFRASFWGRDVPGAPGLDPARIRQVGLMIAARQAGPFALDIRRISLA